jgi:serine/threonine-protein kinase
VATRDAHEQFGRYQLVSRLGGGGMGEVFLARAVGPEHVHKIVVLKRVRPESATDEQARSRFADEARVAVSLAHPHIVPVFEFGELDGRYFLVMEWVRGGELSRIAGIDRPPLGCAATALIGSQLCDALGYVHARHDRAGAALVHGDVTPRNVLLSLDAHALLADFGLARFAARGRAGTARYLAPEQARGETIDGRADLYALALVLCEAATGRPSYDRDPGRAARQAEVGLVPDLDGCDPRLAALLRRALAPTPAGRFADAAAMRDAFEALLDGGARARGRAELLERTRALGAPPPAGSSALGSTLATRGSGPPRRLRLGAALAVGALVIGGGAALSRRHAPTLRAPASAAPSQKDAPPAPLAHSPPDVAPARAKPSPRSHTIAQPEPPHAHLDLNATPWALVRIDGRERGITPLLDLEMAPGAHELEFENQPLGVRHVTRLTLRPGERARHIEDLTKPQ